MKYTDIIIRYVIYNKNQSNIIICIIISAGDFVKFGFTMASTTTILAWGYLSYKDVYEEIGKYEYINLFKKKKRIY